LLTYRELLTLNAHSGDVRCVAFSPCGRILASISRPGPNRGETFLWVADSRLRNVAARGKMPSDASASRTVEEELQLWRVTGSSAGFVTIQCQASDRVLDAARHETHAEAGRVLLCLPNGWPNQQWNIIPVRDGYVRIVCRDGGRCLSADRDQTGAAGYAVRLCEYAGEPNQQWQIEPVGVGCGKIRCRQGGQYLSADPRQLASEQSPVRLSSGDHL
jgi:hypothetical protein